MKESPVIFLLFLGEESPDAIDPRKSPLALRAELDVALGAVKRT
jgi:hypothetical protein